VLVILLPDAGSRYLSKVFDDDWMRENGFLDRAWVDHYAADVHRGKADAEVITAREDDRLTTVVARLKQHGVSQLPVVDDEGRLVGLVRELDLLKHMLAGEHRHEPAETIAPLVDRNVAVVQPNTPLETLMGIFSNRRAVVITSDDRVLGILTQIDLLDFLATQIGRGNPAG
jgi:cystathionine beta-synthase